MASSKFYNVFIGSETGLFKGVHVEKKSWVNLNSLETASKEQEISVLCWADEQQTQICLGRRDGQILVYDRAEGDFVQSYSYPGEPDDGVLKGLAKYQQSFVTCTSTGVLKVWTADEDKLTLDAGEDIYRMRQCPVQENLVGTGGKENNLKIWDLHNPTEPIFKAKNVRNDWLNLQVPVWITDLAFCSDNKQVVTCTGHHQVRVYDRSISQRRPVIDVEFSEHPLLSLSLRPNQQQLMVGNSVGEMALVDLRGKGHVVQKYKGLAGSVRCIQCHPTRPLVASCGIDRFLRIHNIDNKKLLHKTYLKSRLNCLLFGSQWTENDTLEDMDTTPIDLPKMNSKKLDSVEDDEQLWSTMDIVGQPKKRKTKDSIVSQSDQVPIIKRKKKKHKKC